MKQTIFFLLLSVVTLSNASAQTPNTRSAAKQRLLDAGYTIVSSREANLKQGSYSTMEYTFQSGNTYRIYCSSDDPDVKDVDLYISDKYGDVLRKDTDEMDWCMLSWEQFSSATCSLKFVNYRSNTPNYSSTVWILIGQK